MTTHEHTLVRRYRQAGLVDISHALYSGGRHEMLNETKRGEVLQNLLNWLCAQLARSGT
jgi:alpha-beta hydrolase superfamily lysophospholipase